MPEMDDNNTELKCLNCGALVQGKYCHVCGQSTETGRITFKETFQSFLSSAFSFEGPLMSTIRLLIVNPGKVFREYISGKRKAYYKPVPFYILVTAFYIIFRALIGFDPLQGQLEEISHPDASRAEVVSKEAARFMVRNINNIMFFLVFALAFMLKLFFRKRYNLAEYTSVGFFIAGMYTLIGIILMIIGKTLSIPAHQFGPLFLIPLTIYSCASFFQRRTFGAIIKYILLSLLSIVLYVGMGYGFSILMVL